MSRFFSPLRYPGGKGKMSSFIEELVESNGLMDGHYVEPYAGGASVAISLLLKEYVKKITINDYDRALYAFWYSIVNNTDDFCNMIVDTPITIDVWEEQKRIQKEKDKYDLLKLGFSTFFLNRTNRSGIIKAGVIGGKKQDGEWKIDARFNKEDLIKRIMKISKYSSRINLHNVDTLALLKNFRREVDPKVFLYLDPPYYVKGKDLYTNFYKHKDHLHISKEIKKVKSKWLISYDNTSQIRALYSDCNRIEYHLNYSAFDARKGNEIMISSPNLKLPVESEYLSFSQL